MKNLILLPFLILPLAQSFATDLNSRISILEAEMSEISTKTVHGNYAAKTATAKPPIVGENWFFSADLLYWNATEGGTDYAQSFEDLPGAAATESVHNHQLKFEWDLGFRCGAGTTFEHDKWDLSLNFTWFRTQHSSTASAHAPALVVPLYSTLSVSTSEVETRRNIRFYNFDLNLGRAYFISPKLALHPYIGIKPARISQHVHTKSSVFSPAPQELVIKQRNAFFGIGPSLGLEGKWFLPYGFNLIASGGGSLLWGTFTVRHQETPVASRLNLNTHQVVPMAQMQVGFGYDTNIYHNKYRIAVSVRYETQYWWDQNQLPYFPYFIPERFKRYADDLSLQGLTVDAKFDF